MKIQFVEHKNANLGVFWDVNNSECSFQADRHKEHDLLWLGVNVDTTGNPAFRMLLDKSRAAVLIEIMKQFLETGKTPTKPEEMPASVSFNQDKPKEPEPIVEKKEEVK